MSYFRVIVVLIVENTKAHGTEKQKFPRNLEALLSGEHKEGLVMLIRKQSKKGVGFDWPFQA